MEFFINCVPPKTTAQSTTRVFKNKYTGKMFIGKTEKGATTRNELLALLYRFRPKTPFTKPVKVVIRWQYPFLKSETKKNREKGFVWCDKRPDCENICKLFNDCLTRLGFWTDDSLISVLHFEKFYSEKSGIYVSIEEL